MKAHVKLQYFIVKAPSLEHIGFAAYATAETTGLHFLTYGINVWLCVLGLIILWHHDVPACFKEHCRNTGRKIRHPRQNKGQ